MLASTCNYKLQLLRLSLAIHDVVKVVHYRAPEKARIVVVRGTGIRGKSMLAWIAKLTCQSTPSILSMLRTTACSTWQATNTLNVNMQRHVKQCATMQGQSLIEPQATKHVLKHVLKRQLHKRRPNALKAQNKDRMSGTEKQC